MEIKRKIYSKLLEWKEKSQGSKALLIVNFSDSVN